MSAGDSTTLLGDFVYFAHNCGVYREPLRYIWLTENIFMFKITTVPGVAESSPRQIWQEWDLALTWLTDEAKDRSLGDRRGMVEV